MNIQTYWDDLLFEYVAYDADNDKVTWESTTLGFGSDRIEAQKDLMNKLYHGTPHRDNLEGMF